MPVKVFIQGSVQKMDKRKGILALLLVVATIGVFLCFRQSELQEQEKTEHELTLSGNVDVREVSLAFRGSDRIAELLAEEGDSVKKGQVLARLDTQETIIMIEKNKAEIAAQENAVQLLHKGTREEEIRQAEEKLRALRASSTNAQGIKERQEQLFAAGAISKQALDNAVSEAQAQTAETAAAEEAYAEAVNGPRAEEIAQGEATLTAMRQELARQEYLLSQMELVAPTDGVIRSRLLEVGDMASPSLPVFRISLNDKKWVRVYVKETDLAHVFEGQAAEVFIDSLPDKAIGGQVGYISSTAEFTPKTVQTDDLRTSLLYEVRVYVEDDGNVLRMGMPATVHLHF